jgi:hypothetical protein
MLDAIMITDSTSPYTGSGNAATTRSVGYLYNNGSVWKWTTGTYPYTSSWNRISDNMLGLGTDADASVLEPITNKAKAGNGLYYTGTGGVFASTYTMKIEFGVTTWSSATCDSVNPRMNATNVCSVRGMRLPTMSESESVIMTIAPQNPCGSAGSGSSVPSNTSYTWTSTASTDGVNNYWKWTGSVSSSYFHYSDTGYIRCVR